MSLSVARMDTNSPSDQTLALLVEQLTAKLQAGQRSEAEAFVQAHPEHAAALRELLPALHMLADLRHSRGSGAASSFSAAQLTDEVTGTLGDFRIRRELGRGGMGVVYEAEQISLGRRVALKVLPFAGALDPKQLQRFKNEAQAAANLHHQHIVPVYFVGCERGVHYYAMQFIEGQSLAGLIGELRRFEGRKAGGLALSHSAGEAKQFMAESFSLPPYEPRFQEGVGLPAASSAEPTPCPLAAATTEHSSQSPAFFRTVADLGIQAAEALEHAHQMGVIHRDIKPANLILQGQPGSSGAGFRLWITDFGLAHSKGQSGLTMTGDLLGTLRYMSPEQALAKRMLVDLRTDVYSLGVTLYELLTLEPVFSGHDRQELLRQIAFDEPTAPRQRNRAIPVELETIVLKAIEKDPSLRYTTSQELADDLKRFLEDRPIRARRLGMGPRFRKWARRHKSVVVAAVLATVALLIASALSSVLLWQEKNRTQAAYDRAKSNLQLALQALDTYLQATADKAPRDPQRQEEDRAAIEKGLAFYERFAEQNSADPEVWHEAGKAYTMVGKIRHKLGEDSAAEQAAKRAIELLERLTAGGARPEFRESLGAAYESMGVLLTDLGRAGEAELFHRQALAARDELASALPNIPEYQQNQAETHLNLGNLLADRGSSLEAEQSYRRALEIYQTLAARFPRRPEYRAGLGRSHICLGWQLRGQGMMPEAEDSYQQGISCLDNVVALWPSVQEYKQLLAYSLDDLGRVLTEAGRSGKAEAFHRRALRLREELVAMAPNVPDYQNNVAESHVNLGRVLDTLRRPEEAVRDYELGRELLSQLVGRFPQTSWYRLRLAHCHHCLGMHWQDAGCPDQAERAYGQAIILTEELMTRFPVLPSYQNQRAESAGRLAMLARARGDLPLAGQLLEEALRYQRAALQSSPDNKEYRRRLKELVALQSRINR
jgi:serine/threonine protein kinase